MTAAIAVPGTPPVRDAGPGCATAAGTRVGTAAATTAVALSRVPRSFAISTSCRAASPGSWSSSARRMSSSVEDVIETVAAQEQPVAGEEGQLEDSRQLALQPGMRPDDVGEYVPARIAPRRLGGDAALGNLIGHEGMVPRHLRQGIATQKVGAAVTDVGNGGVLAVEQRRCQRRPHAGVRRLVLTGLEHGLVRAAVRLLQGETEITVRKRWKCLDERVHRNLAGDVPGGMPTHAVGHDEKEVFTGARRTAAANCQRRGHVLVLVSPSGVCHRGDGQPQRLLGRLNGSR